MDSLKIRIALFLFTLIFFFSSTVAPALAAITYLYDQNGNMVSDGTKCYEYNEANQLKKVRTCSNNQLIAEYVYDHEGNRLVKKEYENGVLKRTVYSPSDDYETVKLASNGTTQNTTYYYVNDQLIAKKNPDGSKNYYHNDHLGSTNVLTNQSGALVEETKYDPWGEIKAGGTKSKFLFTGQEKDNETSLNYYGARYYDSHIRRFTQPDDIIQNAYDPQSLNRYSYVRNNPLRYTDASGHCFTPAGGLWGNVVSCLSFGFKAAVNLVTKIATNANTTKAVQTADKVQSNQNITNLEKKVIDTTSKFTNNPGTKAVSNVGNTTQPVPGTSTTLWPGPGSGRVILNGLEYTEHALIRMQPKGFVYKEDLLKGTIGTFESRGIPPSVVENAIKYGVKIPNGPDKTMHIFDNIKVVTDNAVTRIVTVMD